MTRVQMAMTVRQQQLVVKRPWHLPCGLRMSISFLCFLSDSLVRNNTASNANSDCFQYFGCKCAQVLTPEEWQAWYVVYLEAASSLEDREARIAAVAERLETNFELIGVTAIEDKLQARHFRV